MLMELIKLSNHNTKKPTRKKTAGPRPLRRDVLAMRIVTFSAALVAALITVMVLQNGSTETAMTFFNVVRPILIPLSALTLALSVVLYILRKRRGVDESRMILSSSMLIILTGGLFGVVVAYSTLSATRLLVCLIAVSAVFYIFYLYPRTFFVYSALTLVGGLTLSFMRFGGELVGLILPAVVLVALEVVLMLLLVNGGKYIPSESRERLPFVLTAAILLVGLVLGFVAPTMLFYAVALLFASFLVIAIINTLRMM